MEKLHISNSQELEDLLNFVHDRNFDLEEIHFDELHNILKIPLTVFSDSQNKGHKEKRWWGKSTLKFPLFQAELLFKNVRSFEILDEAKTGEGNINTISFEGGKIKIKGGLPVEININVTQLEIELNVTDTIVKWVSSFRRSYLKA